MLSAPLWSSTLRYKPACDSSAIAARTDMHEPQFKLPLAAKTMNKEDGVDKMKPKHNVCLILDEFQPRCFARLSYALFCVCLFHMMHAVD